MLKNNYKCDKTIARRIQDLVNWQDNPTLLRRDLESDSEFHTILDIDLTQITEPIICKPNDPDNVDLLSNIKKDKVNEVFIGSCMTNITHYRQIGDILKNINVNEIKTKIWIAPPTNLDQQILEREGYYDIFKKHGIHLETPGCSLCMGNQARVADNSTVVSTSTRNFPNRLGKQSNVYLASPELTIASAILGKVPSVSEYMQIMAK
jgi:aconitate hydratase 2/2-methylisocitrate dehydratase